MFLWVLTDFKKGVEIVNSDAYIDSIVKQVMQDMSYSGPSTCVFETMDQAIEAASRAQKALVKLTFEERGKIIEAMRKVTLDHTEELAAATIKETGMGNYEHKLLKNRLAATKTPGIEDLVTKSCSGDHGLTLEELSPYGVIGSITPTTNPTETIICNAIGMIAAGNGVVFAPHPRSHNVSVRHIQLLNEAIVGAGGPLGIITTVKKASMEAVDAMMKHPKIEMLVATGGPGVVKAVMSSGKKAIGAGAGNPPVIVDDTADIEKAARDIVAGASFDNNLPCIAEKEAIVLENVCDYLIFQMQASGAHLISDAAQLKALENLVLVDGNPNKDYIGQSASHILNALGIAHKDDTKLIIVETTAFHPFVQHEMMMPVLPIVRVKNIVEAIKMAVDCEHGYRHTAIMHSKNIDHLSAFGKAVQTTVFVKNGPSFAGLGVGGEGYNTFTIAGPTGEGLTSAKDFARRRRCVLVDGFNIK